MTHVTLVGDTGQATGARQHTEQRHFRQRHRTGAIIDQQNFVAGECELVAATGTRAIHGGEKFQPGILTRIFETVTRFVGEFAEIHFPAVARHAQHENVGTGAEDAVARAGHHHRAHFRMLKPNTVDRIMQLDVDPKVVAVELQFVARLQTGVFVDIHRQRGNCAVERERPVVVLRRLSAVIDIRGGNGGSSGGSDDGCVHVKSPFVGSEVQ